jgi:hypothetical protein
LIVFPSACETRTAGIVTWFPTTPAPSVAGVPGALSATIMAVAPAFWALMPFTPNSQKPRSTSAMAPAGNPTRGSQPSLTVPPPAAATPSLT